MKKNLRLLLCLLFFCAASIQPLYAAKPAIIGGNATIHANILARLAEISDHSPLRNKSTVYLKQQIGLAIQPYGYFNTNVQLKRDSTGELTSIRIKLGAPIRITALHIDISGEGQKEKEIIDAKRAITLKPGQIFESAAYEAAKQSLFNAAEHQGYLKGRFTTSVVRINRKTLQALVTLVFDTGPQYYFGHTRFDPTNITQSLLRRYLPYKSGDIYETSTLLQLNNNLSSSGYFKQVTVTPDIGNRHYVPVNVHLQATSRLSYMLGAGYGTDTGIRGKAGLFVVPVNQYGHKFSLIAQGSQLQNSLQARYAVPGHDPVTDQYDVSLDVGNQNYDVGYANSILASVASRHTTADYQRTFSLNLLQEDYRYTNQARQKSMVFFPRSLLIFKHTTDPMFTPTGFSVSINVIGASNKIASDITFIQGAVDTRAALYLTPIRTRLYAHATQGYNTISNINQLPLSMAFLLGGPDNMKGYAINSINSINPGKILNYAGLEIQKETKEGWYVLGFVDAGDVYNPVPRNFKYDVGVGLMWVSPVGPIKLGVAQAVTRNGQRIRGKNPQLVISMGPDI